MGLILVLDTKDYSGYRTHNCRVIERHDWGTRIALMPDDPTEPAACRYWRLGEKSSFCYVFSPHRGGWYKIKTRRFISLVLRRLRHKHS